MQADIHLKNQLKRSRGKNSSVFLSEFDLELVAENGDDQDWKIVLKGSEFLEGRDPLRPRELTKELTIEISRWDFQQLIEFAEENGLLTVKVR
jgi:hypothetical protein